MSTQPEPMDTTSTSPTQDSNPPAAQPQEKTKKKDKLLVTTSPAITTSTKPDSVPEGYEYFSEGSYTPVITNII